MSDLHSLQKKPLFINAWLMIWRSAHLELYVGKHTFFQEKILQHIYTSSFVCFTKSIATQLSITWWWNICSRDEVDQTNEWKYFKRYNNKWIHLVWHWYRFQQQMMMKWESIIEDWCGPIQRRPPNAHRYKGNLIYMIKSIMSWERHLTC